jgi:hypothetical protein
VQLDADPLALGGDCRCGLLAARRERRLGEPGELAGGLAVMADHPGDA